MRIKNLDFYPLMGIRGVRLAWASTMVFFGPNDAGKSRVIESIARTFDPEFCDPKCDPYLDSYEPDTPYTHLEVELDGLAMAGHPDQELLLEWWAERLQGIPDDDPFAPLADALVVLPPAGSPTRAAEVAGYIETCLRHVRASDLAWSPAGFTDGSIRSDYELILDACLASRSFRFGQWDAEWLAPRESELTPVARSALQRLRDRAVELGIAMPFEQEFPGGQDGQGPFLDFGSFNDFRPDLFRIFPIRLSGRDHGGFYHALEQFIDDVLYGRLRLRAPSPQPAPAPREANVDCPYPEHPEYAINILFLDPLPPAPKNVDPWLKRQEGAVSISPEVLDACNELAESANALAPAFVSDTYRIRIVPLLPDHWPVLKRRVSVRLQLVRDTETEFDLSMVSAGIGTWVTIAVSEAMRVARDKANSTSQGDRPSPAQTTYLFILDEPELHLHPLAQEQAAEWVAARAREGANVWLATHSLPFLRLPLEDVEYFKVARRTDTWETVVQPITDDIVGAVRDSADELGLPPVAFIQLTRAWLVVEGEHDRKVIHAFYGDELRRSGVQILALRGASHAKASFLNLDALSPLGLPFFAVLDNIRAAAIKTGSVPDGETEEEKIAQQLLHLRDTPGLDLEVKGLPYPDIICALPFDAVQTIASQRCGRPEAASSWRELIAQHEGLTRNPAGKRRPPGFKRFALDALGLKNLDPDTFVTEALQASDGRAPDGDPLGRIIAEITARADPSPPTGT